MARPRDLRLWSFAFLALCLLAAAGGLTGGTSTGVDHRAPQPAVAALSPTVDVAVLPARLVGEVRSAAAAGHVSVVVLSAVLAALLGLPALVRRPSPLTGPGRRPLHIRRHTIALRAPPLPFAA